MRERALAWKWPGNEFSLRADDSLNQWSGPDPRPDEAALQQAEIEYAVVASDVEGDARAGHDLNTPLNKTLRDIFLDLEIRLRAAGQTSSLPGIAAATDPAEYTAALRGIHKTYQ